jgi:hypothetical protein
LKIVRTAEPHPARAGIQGKTAPFVVFGLIFLYFLLWVDPCLLYEAQTPAFLTGSFFLSPFLAYPGGAAWYCSDFLTQFYRFPLAGALLITLLFALISLLTARALKTACVPSAPGLALLPALALAAVYSHYAMPLTYALELAAGLFCFCLYGIRPSSNAPLRMLRYLPLLAAAYWLASTGAPLFAVLCAIRELHGRRKLLPGVFALLAGAALPAIAARFFFVLLVPEAYGDLLGFRTFLLDAAASPRIPLLMYALFAYAPLVIVAHRFVVPLCKKPGGMLKGNAPVILPGAGVVLFALFALVGFDGRAKANLEIEYFAAHRMWNEITQKITPLTVRNYSPASQVQLFRALFYEGRLLEELFTYPQGMPGQSIEMVTGPLAKRFPMLMSDLTFDAGGLNTAEYWAHEALAMQGEKSRILERLAAINILKGRRESARKFVRLLGKTPFGGAAAARYSRMIDDSALVSADPCLQQAGAYRSRSEFVDRDFYFDLATQLDGYNKNRMAVEFLTARNLMHNAVGPVLNNIVFFSDAGYASLPRAVQEALAFQAVLAGSPSRSAGAFRLDDLYFRRFDDFYRIIRSCGGNRAAALKALNPQFGSTYWYFVTENGQRLYLKK